jgi:hypothetical protein
MKDNINTQKIHLRSERSEYLSTFIKNALNFYLFFRTDFVYVESFDASLNVLFEKK